MCSLLNHPAPLLINPLTTDDHYSGRTAPLTSKSCIIYTNIGTEYIKHRIYSSFFSSSKCSLFHNSNVFDSCIIHILYTGCAKLKKNNSGDKRFEMWLCGYQSASGHQWITAESLPQLLRRLSQTQKCSTKVFIK